jgi:DNA-binding transcriptional ArsR family regulator
MNTKQFIKIVDAISDEIRLKILKLIAKKGEISCLEITKRVKMSQPTISHHLKVLTDSGVVNVRRSGKFGFFSLNYSALKTVSDKILKLTKRR